MKLVERKLGLMSSEKESENCTCWPPGSPPKEVSSCRWWQPCPSPLPKLTCNRDGKRNLLLQSTPLSWALSYRLSLLLLTTATQERYCVPTLQMSRQSLRNAPQVSQIDPASKWQMQGLNQSVDFKCSSLSGRPLPPRHFQSQERVCPGSQLGVRNVPRRREGALQSWRHSHSYF